MLCQRIFKKAMLACVCARRCVQDPLSFCNVMEEEEDRETKSSSPMFEKEKVKPTHSLGYDESLMFFPTLQ